MNTDKKIIQLPQSSVKSRFFAQYWGQKVMKKNIEGLENFYSEPDGFIRSMTIDSPLFLELKPLSKATREEVFDTYCKMWEFNENLIETDTKIAIDWFQNYGKPHYVKFNQEQTDFLRSKGYAIPFMEYSVDDLVSFGWVKLL
ncbi:MAG: hypothetical protein RSE15_04875 [Flavobacterium sp.]|uniref:hypothetical protein n=1 Tax=Flavobacterium sp. TaxID=239 RepID=UPI002B49ABCB|nr:hypothetical protein [Flavobacterium sp.]WRH74162.1 MAG: hypothetical protein RSE15_04875 [Flavobacterium sp.]